MEYHDDDTYTGTGYTTDAYTDLSKTVYKAGWKAKKNGDDGSTEFLEPNANRADPIG